MPEISNTIKIIVAIVATIVCYFSYKYYDNYYSPDVISEPLPDNIMIEQLKEKARNYPDSNTQYKGIYLYSTTSGKIFLRNKDGKIYKAGNLSDCPYLKDDNITAYEIKDVVTTFNCSVIPDKYKNNCVGKTTSTDSVQITTMTAEEFEKKLEDNAEPGDDYTIPVYVCNPPSDVKGGTNSEASFLFKTYTNFADFVSSNQALILNFIKTFGMMKALQHFPLVFQICVVAVPGIFSTDAWESQKSSFMTMQMISHWFIGTLVEITKSVIKAFEAGADFAIKEADGAIMKIATKIAIKIAQKIASEIAIRIFEMILEAITQVLDGLAILQMIGMAIDIFDFCKLNSINNNIDQSILTDLKNVSDLTMNLMFGKEMLYPKIWDPTYNYCHYDLRGDFCEQKFKNCSNQVFLKGQKWGDMKYIEDKTKTNEITSDDYCKDINNEFQKYSDEYIENLKVNAYGQCITTTSNPEIAEIFKTYFPDYAQELDFLYNLNSDNYPLDLFPKNDVAKQLSIMAVNENSVVAEYVKSNFYYFLSFFIIIMIIILFV